MDATEKWLFTAGKAEACKLSIIPETTLKKNLPPQFVILVARVLFSVVMTGFLQSNFVYTGS